MVFQKPQIIDSLEAVPASVATAIERQTLIIPSKTSEKEYLYLNRGGVGYQGLRCHLRFPWPSIKDSMGDDYLTLGLNSSQGGIGYLVHQSKVPLEEETEPLPLQINEGEAVFQNIFKLPSSVIAAIINECQKKISNQRDQQLTQGFFRGSGSSIVGKDDKHTTVFLTPGSPPKFPAFCPINGTDCDSITYFNSQNSADLIPWSVSTTGAKELHRQSRVRLASAFVSLVLYVLLGLYLHFTHLNGQASFPWKEALQGLTLFATGPIVWWVTRSRMTLSRRGGIRVSFADPEYYKAFLAINDFSD